jgi:hypothetical protein
MINLDFANGLVSAGTASWIEPSRCRELADLLTERMPWMGYHVAWHTVEGSVTIDWGQLSDEAVNAAMRDLAALQGNEVYVLYSGRLGLAFPRQWFLQHPDVAGCNAQQYFAFRSLVLAEALSSVAEFEAGSHIWGMLANQSHSLGGGSASGAPNRHDRLAVSDAKC